MNIARTELSFCMSTPFYPEGHQTFKDYAREPAEIQPETKNRQKIPQNSGVLLEPFDRGGVLLPEGRTSPLQVMWRGAVNRQPGYRARN